MFVQDEYEKGRRVRRLLLLAVERKMGRGGEELGLGKLRPAKREQSVSVAIESCRTDPYPLVAGPQSDSSAKDL